MITQHDLDNWFTYHPPRPEDIDRYKIIRDMGKEFARTVLELTPPSADQTAAIRKIREAVATANMSIACDPNNKTPEQVEEFNKFKRGLLQNISDPELR